MSSSHPSVYPVEALPPPPPATDAAAVAAAEVEIPMPRGRMKEVQGMPGTPAGLALRLCQFAFSAIALSVMASTSDFPSVTAFCYLVAAASLQSLWSLSLAIVDIYAILVKRSLRNFRVVTLFAIGDGPHRQEHFSRYGRVSQSGPYASFSQSPTRGLPCYQQTQASIAEAGEGA